MASTKDAELLEIEAVELMVEPSIKRQPKIMELIQEPSWMDSIVTYFKNGELLEGKTNAQIL